MITIESSWGTINCDDNGNVIERHLLTEYEGEECYLNNATKFDLKEWDEFYEQLRKEPSPKPAHFDVLELGFWNADGTYNKADNEWRLSMYN